MMAIYKMVMYTVTNTCFFEDMAGPCFFTILVFKEKSIQFTIIAITRHFSKR